MTAVAVVVLIGDAAAAATIRRDHTPSHTAATVGAPAPPGCPSVVLPSRPATPLAVSEATAKADAVELRPGTPVTAASAAPMAVYDYLALCGVAAVLKPGRYATVWVVTVRAAGGSYTVVVDAGQNQVVGACPGSACSGVPAGENL